MNIKLCQKIEKVEKEYVGDDIEGDLILKAQNELPYDDHSYNELMTRYESTLFNVCKRLLDNPEDAKEASQEVMIKVYHYLSGFERRSSFKTWLYRITQRVCYTHYHKNKYAYLHTNLDEMHEHDYIDKPADSDDKIDVEKILSRLKYNERQILTLRFIADMDISEIAETLEISLSAAKMRLYRAIDRARYYAGP